MPSSSATIPALMVVAALLFLLVAFLLIRQRRTATMQVHASLEKIKEMGELAVMTAYIKEVVTMKTEEDNRLSTTGKIILICPYEIEFRYNLRKIKASTTGATTNIILPPHHVKAIPGKVEFYDERKASYFNVWSIDFTPEQRNTLLGRAADEAMKQAGVLQGDLQDKVEASATTTLKALAHAFGITDIQFSFESSHSVVQQIFENQHSRAA